MCSRPCARLRLHGRVHAMCADPRFAGTVNDKVFFVRQAGKKNNFNLTPRAIELRVGRACTRSLVASKAFAYVRVYVYTWVQIVPYVCLYLYIYISARCVDSGAAADDE